MNLLTIERVREHLRADTDESDALLTFYATAAEQLCAKYANRNFYPTADALALAVTNSGPAVVSAYATYDAALAAANGISDWRISTMQRDAAVARLHEKTAELARAQNGVVADEMIHAAVLMTLGSLYENREDAPVSQANVLNIPMNARFILDLNMRLGTT